MSNVHQNYTPLAGYLDKVTMQKVPKKNKKKNRENLKKNPVLQSKSDRKSTYWKEKY